MGDALGFPEIGAKAPQLLFDAHRRGDVRDTSGRASDFRGAGGTLTQLGDYFWLKEKGDG